MKKVECGDIIKTRFGIMIVEKVVENNGWYEYVGHELKEMTRFMTKDCNDVKILNSDFRYKSELEEGKEYEEN